MNLKDKFDLLNGEINRRKLDFWTFSVKCWLGYALLTVGLDFSKNIRMTYLFSHQYYKDTSLLKKKLY